MKQNRMIYTVHKVCSNMKYGKTFPTQRCGRNRGYISAHSVAAIVRWGQDLVGHQGLLDCAILPITIVQKQSEANSTKDNYTFGGFVQIVGFVAQGVLGPETKEW